MGSYHYHYASTSQFVFAATDSDPKPARKPKTTVRIPITSPPEERAWEEGPPPDAVAAAKIQAAFRGHQVRRHVAAVRVADAEATRWSGCSGGRSKSASGRGSRRLLPSLGLKKVAVAVAALFRGSYTGTAAETAVRNRPQKNEQTEEKAHHLARCSGDRRP